MSLIKGLFRPQFFARSVNPIIVVPSYSRCFHNHKQSLYPRKRHPPRSNNPDPITSIKNIVDSDQLTSNDQAENDTNTSTPLTKETSFPSSLSPLLHSNDPTKLDSPSQSSKTSNQSDIFETIIKKEVSPLHPSGHCSLEDRDGSELLTPVEIREIGETISKEKKTEHTSNQGASVESNSGDSKDEVYIDKSSSAQENPSVSQEIKKLNATEDDSSKPTSSSVSLEDIKDLPSQKESKKSNVTKWMNTNLDKLQRYIFTAGQTLNEFTGYSSIESLKISIEHQEALLKRWRQEVHKEKEAYARAISNRSASQREVNELLQRKHAWAPQDLERFTELYRSDHANQHAEAEAEKNLTKAEKASEEAQAQLSHLISARYHEEQIWSDKIRRASTWGTWGLMGINICLFITVQLVIEPRKRGKMVNSFEEVMRKTFEDEKIIRKQENAATAAAAAAAAANAATANTVASSSVHSEKTLPLGSSLGTTDPDNISSSNWTPDDRKTLERIEQLAEAEHQVLQRLTATFPSVSEPAEILSDTELGSPQSDPEISSSSLTWGNLPSRVLGENFDPYSIPNGTFEIPKAATLRSVEIAGAMGTSVVIGVVLGSIITLIAKN